MTKLLLSQEIHPDARQLLGSGFETAVLDSPSPDSLRQAVSGVEGIILRTNVSVTRDIIAAAPELKIISRTGAGVDNVDVAAATERGILVCNTPAANNLSVAEHTVALVLSLAKDLPAMDRAVRGGSWKLRNSGRPMELAGKTLGVIGMGRIGSSVARKCRDGFGMNIIAHDPYAASALGGEFKFSGSMEYLFTVSDFITLHCPNIPETRGMVNRALLGVMKKSAFIVNCARGGVIDEEALLDALKAQSIAGAALDVFAEEPPSGSGFLTLDNVILSPHSAALTKEASVRVAVEAAQAVVDFFSGKQPDYIFNEKELKNHGCI
ncbi:MAG: hydroxyacid dehydrogenase [Treponema sp.]|jgi:D-3-phosphoglycerate dehydrogenase|nr:hydroxyacid dehydrogenase [Treponema sp.]